ncbi:MAG TPA: alpha-amylase family glycosyl hydrolase [Acidimicrobiia bacterium]|nr:alpha-amylase family glycosyl hydrolase [Acidimicrobiia bacterium]
MSWWAGAVGYEIYIRSFADSDGNGIGDFAGIAQKLDHLAWLGIDLVWVTPFYPSPQADFGYDVADYVGVDPTYGDMDAFAAFVGRAHELGLKVMIDIVPNHTSSEHPWFRAALADPSAPERDFYIFRPPGPDGGPPNNWLSHFGGPAWTFDEASGEYYCHLFLAEQPDLNWANPAVRHAFDEVLGFWMDRGVDGFRIDVAHALMKDPDLSDNPQILELGPAATPGEAMAAFDHIHDMGQESTKEIYRRWKALAGADVVLVGEVYVKDVELSSSYMGDGGLDICLFFGLNRRPWDAVAFVDEIRTWSQASEGGFAWTLGSHDENRPPTRFGAGDLGRARALTLWTLLCALPGLPFVYQGEELGLEDGYVSPEDVQDPVGKAAYAEGRDPCRTPMPWEPVEHGGFTTGEPWLRSAPRRPEETVAVQRDDPGSHLHLFRRLLAVRRALAPRRRTPVEWLPSPPGVALVLAGDVLAVANATDDSVDVTLPPGDWSLVFETVPGRETTASGVVTIAPATARILTPTR